MNSVQKAGKYGHTSWRYPETEEAASLWIQGVGGTAYWGGFPAQMQRVRSSDHDTAPAGREKYTGNHTP